MNAPAAPPRRTGRRVLKVLGGVLLALGALATVLYLVAGALLGAGVEAAGRAILGVPVEASGVRLRLAGGLRTAWVSVGNPEGFEDPTAFRCDGLAVVTPLTALLRNPVQVREVVVRRPEVTLELAPRKVDGRRTNWSVLLERLKAAGEEAKKKASGAAPSKEFVIERIRLLEPRLRFRAPMIAPDGVVLTFNDIELDRVGSAPGTRSTPSLALAAVMQALFGGQVREDDLPGPLRSSVRGELKEAASAFGELLDAR